MTSPAAARSSERVPRTRTESCCVSPTVLPRVDVVEDGLVLFYVDHRVTCPGQVTVLDGEGLALSDYAEFELFA